jgi:uncharacterized phage protein (TIGR01671 family)
MREIKFRAWDNTSREIGGQKIISWDELIDLDNNGLLPLAGVLLGESEDLILMQFTGLKDKNGKEIFEGDGIRDRAGRIRIVKFIDGCFTASNKYVDNCLSADIDAFTEVIGNTYENPDLLP